MNDRLSIPINGPAKKLIFSVSFEFLISLLALTLVILKLDPYESPQIALPFFFISFFMCTAGLFTLVLLGGRYLKLKNKLALDHIGISIRQGLLLAFCLNACAALLMLGLLRIWNGLLIVIIITSIEFYFSLSDEA